MTTTTTPAYGALALDGPAGGEWLLLTAPTRPERRVLARLAGAAREAHSAIDWARQDLGKIERAIDDGFQVATGRSAFDLLAAAVGALNATRAAAQDLAETEQMGALIKMAARSTGKTYVVGPEDFAHEAAKPGAELLSLN